MRCINIDIPKPIYKLMITQCEKDGPIMGVIYEVMDNMLEEIKDVLISEKEQVLRCICRN